MKAAHGTRSILYTPGRLSFVQQAKRKTVAFSNTQAFNRGQASPVNTLDIYTIKNAERLFKEANEKTGKKKSELRFRRSVQVE